MSSSRSTSVAKAKDFWKAVMGEPQFGVSQPVIYEGKPAMVVGIEDGSRRLYDRRAEWLYTVVPNPEYTPPSRLTGLAWPVGAFTAVFITEGVLAEMQA